MRLLDKLEEQLISLLMVAAVTIIFVAVCQRYSIGILAEVVAWSRKNDYPWLMDQARSAYRSLRGLNLLWAQELCIYLFVWMAKFGAAYGVRIGIHAGVDVLSSRVSAANRRRLTITSLLAGALFTAIIVWIGSRFVWGVALNGTVSADLEVPMWIVYLAVPLGSALMCLRFLQVLAVYLRTGAVPHHDHSHVAELGDHTEDHTEEPTAQAAS